MNPYESRMFDELVTKECLQTITLRDKEELDRLESIRNKEIDERMDDVDPGWRKREQAWRRKVNRLIKKLEKARQ